MNDYLIYTFLQIIFGSMKNCSQRHLILYFKSFNQKIIPNKREKHARNIRRFLMKKMKTYKNMRKKNNYYLMTSI